MKSLRYTRIVLELIFLASTAAYFALGDRGGFSNFSHHLQIMTMMLAETAGVAAIWCVVTLIWGRIYCSSVCPVGTLLDGFIFLRKHIRPRRPFRYSQSAKFRYIVLCIYIALLVCGLSGAAFIVDPWSMTGNIAGAAGSETARTVWVEYSVGLALGAGIGVLSVIIIGFCGLFFGRDYCNFICPVGLALGIISSRSIFNIVIEPDKCSSCLKCEDVCKASCIKVSERYIDNTRCVRCFDCIGVCDDKALHFRAGAPRAGTPLMQRSAE